MSASLVAKAGSRDRLKLRSRCGCSRCACQIVAPSAARDHRLGHRPAGPMGRLVRRFGAGQGHHLGRFIGRDRRLAGLAGPVAQQPLDPGFSEALLPAPCRRPAEAEAVSNPLHWSPIGRGKHDTRPLDVLSRPVAVSDDRCQPFPVRSADDHTYCLSHRPGSHIARPV